MVVGTRPSVSTTEVVAYLNGRLGVVPGTFIAYPFHPEDFLIVFQDGPEMLRVLNAPTPDGPFRLTFRRWRRENWAVDVALRYQVQVDIKGVPPHLWLRSTVHDILCSSCAVINLAPESESKADLKELVVVQPVRSAGD
jgi:hypothetical protein